MKKNPSRVTLARRAVDRSILATAKRISYLLIEKASPSNIAIWGLHLGELYQLNSILVSHEQANKPELTQKAIREIGSIIKKYTEVKQEDETSWLGILKSMVGQKKV